MLEPVLREREGGLRVSALYSGWNLSEAGRADSLLGGEVLGKETRASGLDLDFREESEGASVNTSSVPLLEPLEPREGGASRDWSCFIRSWWRRICSSICFLTLAARRASRSSFRRAAAASSSLFFCVTLL